jgi:hypothetical protein
MQIAESELIYLFRTSLVRKIILSLIQDTYCSSPMKRQQRPQRPVTRKWHPQSTRRVATATLLRAFHHYGTWWGWGLTPTPFHYIYHRVQSWGVRSIWEGRYTPLFLLYPYVYSVVTTPPLPPHPPFLGVQFNNKKQQSFLLTVSCCVVILSTTEEESFPIKKTTFSSMYSLLVLVHTLSTYLYICEYLFYLFNSKPVAKFIVPDWGI